MANCLIQSWFCVTKSAKFDYQLAQESFKLYSSIDISKIENKEVSNVKFISNLLNSKNIDAKIDEPIKPPINN